MRYLEMRRHSRRVRPNEHLSQEGVTLARRLGLEMGPFDLVVSMPAARGIETAVAMGFAVGEELTPVHSSFAPEDLRELDRLLSEGTPHAERARAMRSDALAARFAQALVAQWTGYAERLRDNGRALVILGGGYLDDAAVACLPDAPHETWGPNFSHCEGIVLAFGAGRCVGGEILRVGTRLPTA